MIQKKENAKQLQNKLKKQQERSKILDTELRDVMNACQSYSKIAQNQQDLIHNLVNFHNEDNTVDSILLNKYLCSEILTGIEVRERCLLKSRNKIVNASDESSWYDILFTCLPDECLDLEKNLDDYPTKLKQNLPHLSSLLIDNYKSTFRVGALNCLTLIDLLK